MTEKIQPPRYKDPKESPKSSLPQTLAPTVSTGSTGLLRREGTGEGDG